jgi:hypothetical protein
LSGTIKAVRDWAQKAVETGNNRDIWELAYQLFTPDVSRVLRITPKPWVPPGEGDFAFQTKAAAAYKEHRLEQRENPYRAPPAGQLHLTAAQQERLKTIREGIAQRAEKSKQLAQESLAEQRELNELTAQSEKNKEFIYLRERMVDLVGSTEIHIPELSVSLIDTRGEAVDESLVHMTEPEETSTPVSKKKGKTLKSKSTKGAKTNPAAAGQSVEPSQGATTGPSPPVGRIEALKAAKKVLADSARSSTPERSASSAAAATPERPSTTIDEDIAAISHLLSPFPEEGNPVKRAKERVAHKNKSLFGGESE